MDFLILQTKKIAIIKVAKEIITLIAIRAIAYAGNEFEVDEVFFSL